jgi:hypothetical protein
LELVAGAVVAGAAASEEACLKKVPDVDGEGL